MSNDPGRNLVMNIMVQINWCPGYNCTGYPGVPVLMLSLVAGQTDPTTTSSTSTSLGWTATSQHVPVVLVLLSIRQPGDEVTRSVNSGQPRTDRDRQPQPPEPA
eukprot:2434978-Rhodomonas_salina.2